LDEYQPLIIVSEKVAKALKKLDGVDLRDADGWNDSHRF